MTSDQVTPVHTRHWRAPEGSGYQPAGMRAHSPFQPLIGFRGDGYEDAGMLTSVVTAIAAQTFVPHATSKSGVGT